MSGQRGRQLDGRDEPDRDRRSWQHADTADVVQLMSVMFIRVPITIFVGSMEICTRAMRQVERIVGLGVDTMLSGSTERSTAGPNGSRPVDVSSRDTTAHANAAAIVAEEQQETQQQEVSMDDTNLSDDMVKLVEYDIVFIKRDQERRVHSSTQLVTANMTGESFGAWMIAAYLQSDAYTRHVEVHPTHVITHDDKKYLRVSYTVKSRWPREKEEYEKDQAEALRQLAAAGMVHTEVLARQTGMLDEFRRMGVDVLQKQTDALEDVSEQLKDGLKQLDETLNKRKR